jgi:hypothetical protein
MNTSTSVQNDVSKVHFTWTEAKEAFFLDCVVETGVHVAPHGTTTQKWSDTAALTNVAGLFHEYRNDYIPLSPKNLSAKLKRMLDAFSKRFTGQCVNIQVRLHSV